MAALSTTLATLSGALPCLMRFAMRLTARARSLAVGLHAGLCFLPMVEIETTCVSRLNQSHMYSLGG
jgi:hypothetical protein